ncbi:MAG: WD40 repeat domain-containing protein [bacterium]
MSAVYFHPDFPLILTASEDGIVKFWNSNTYRLE